MATTPKLYVDSHKANGAGQDFTVLEQSIQCPAGTSVHLDEVIVPKGGPNRR